MTRAPDDAGGLEQGMATQLVTGTEGLPVAKEEGALPFLKGACSLNPKAGLLISLLCLCGLFSGRLCFLSVIPAASSMGSNSPGIGLHPHF